MTSLYKRPRRRSFTRIKVVLLWLITSLVQLLFVDVPAAFCVMIGLRILHDKYHEVPAMGFWYALVALLVLECIYGAVTTSRVDE